MLSERPVDHDSEGFDVTVRVEEMPDSSLIARHSLPAVWSSAAHRVFRAAPCRGRPPISQPHNCLTAAGNVLSYLLRADGPALRYSAGRGEYHARSRITHSPPR